MAVDFQISIGSTVPIYRQIIDGVRRGVTNGELAVGDQLPSVRALAERLLVNHNTVAKAYQALVRDGVIESRHGRGVFVAKRRNIYTKAERHRRLDAALQAFVGEALLLDFDDAEIRQAVEKKLNDANGRKKRGDQ
ncbi:MAG: GntR family transcriptional regulator [Planctomycetaceae bacterium]|nr:GntR family transcriptional regulator [Planctomycetaceae bacterium]MBT6496407.1 GntR family transcriptional regulator [Planctomycetaceae bacterium]